MLLAVVWPFAPTWSTSTSSQVTGVLETGTQGTNSIYHIRSVQWRGGVLERAPSRINTISSDIPASIIHKNVFSSCLILSPFVQLFQDSSVNRNVSHCSFSTLLSLILMQPIPALILHFKPNIHCHPRLHIHIHPNPNLYSHTNPTLNTNANTNTSLHPNPSPCLTLPTASFHIMNHISCFIECQIRYWVW
jgi:hypothetical protein